MEILTSAKVIRKALRELEPSSIAVAYVGTGWKNYVSTKHLREIVLSPTLGSNPRAIEEMMQELGHENVYFLDDLHSKIYLGTNAALLGSCNLSNNGISDQGRLEAAVVLVSKKSRKQLAEQIEHYKEVAKKLYPTRQKKLMRLRKLKDEWNKLHWAGLGGVDGKKTPSLADYNSELDRIHVSWCGSEGSEYNLDKIRNAIPSADSVAPDGYFADTLQIHEDDDVLVGDWILCWSCKNDGQPKKRGDISWMQVHHVISHGFDDAQYSKLAGQAKSEFREPAAPPFVLDPPIKSAIREVLDSGKFPELLSSDESTWYLGPADAVMPAFIDALRKASRERPRRK